MTPYDQLLQEGFYFEAPKKFTAKFSKNKSRRFHFESPTLAVLSKLSDLYLKLDLPENIAEFKAETPRQSFLCCQVVAVAYLGFWARIPGLSLAHAWYFHHHIDTDKLNMLQQVIHALSNYPAFVAAIRNMSAAPRTTAPLPTEE